MRRKPAFFLVLLLIALVGFAPAKPATAQQPSVNAILFYSPTCPHCHDVMDNHLPPLKAQYGEQLRILQVDVTTMQGQQIYQKALSFYQVPQNRMGVPAMAIGADIYLVGDGEAFLGVRRD